MLPAGGHAEDRARCVSAMLRTMFKTTAVASIAALPVRSRHSQGVTWADVSCPRRPRIERRRLKVRRRAERERVTRRHPPSGRTTSRHPPSRPNSGWPGAALAGRWLRSPLRRSAPVARRSFGQTTCLRSPPGARRPLASRRVWPAAADAPVWRHLHCASSSASRPAPSRRPLQWTRTSPATSIGVTTTITASCSWSWSCSPSFSSSCLCGVVWGARRHWMHSVSCFCLQILQLQQHRTLDRTPSYVCVLQSGARHTSQGV